MKGQLDLHKQLSFVWDKNLLSGCCQVHSRSTAIVLPYVQSIQVFPSMSSIALQLKHCVDLAKEHGASSWLSVLPLTEQGFHLHKGVFRDALCLRYGWSLFNIPQLCTCSKVFTIDHAMLCLMGVLHNLPQ